MTPSQELKRLRQRTIRQLVASRPVGSQRELVDALIEQGFAVTQATVSRDVTELGLLKVPRSDQRPTQRRSAAMHHFSAKDASCNP